jgi:hypothetical protein
MSIMVLMLGAKGPGNVTEWRVDTVEPFDSKEFQRIGSRSVIITIFPSLDLPQYLLAW